MIVIAPISADDLKNQLDRDLQGVMTKVTDWRHHFHEYPELSNREYKTQESIVEALTEMGLEPNTEFGITGVTAFIRGQNPGPLIALRADIDGLPVTEKLNLPYCENPNDYLNNKISYILDKEKREGMKVFLSMII